MIEFFDRDGGEAVFCHDGHSLYLWNGKAAAFIHDDKVYAYDGRFIGWADRGWISDEDGACLLFERDAVGGPPKPQRQGNTTPGPRRPKPARAEMQQAPSRPASFAAWSHRVFSDLI
ncbi:4-fold beta flower protein [Methylobacterium sp.]|uniref:4-fold beta flower protein n=1 Tax=Methylobacterium sp. TaxID=409 RepID=UPI003B5BD418